MSIHNNNGLPCLSFKSASVYNNNTRFACFCSTVLSFFCLLVISMSVFVHLYIKQSLKHPLQNTETLTLIKTARFSFICGHCAVIAVHNCRTPTQQMCLISAPTGKINIISGDFGDSSFQHIGYPDFVTVENAVQMPLGRGKH